LCVDKVGGEGRGGGEREIGGRGEEGRGRGAKGRRREEGVIHVVNIQLKWESLGTRLVIVDLLIL